MRYIKNEINVSRPLIFLCGPYTNTPNNRRQVLSNYIRDNYGSLFEKQNKFRPVPFIVDDVFNEFKIGKYQLNLSLLEEIVALISYRSYIYLDTLSTSMELGLFSNNLVKNEVRVLTPHEDILNFSKRPKIGKFIDLSVDSTSKNIKRVYYDCKIDSNGFSKFINDELPFSIKELVDLDISELSKYISAKINFINSKSTPTKLGEISYIANSDILTLNIEFKTLFYFILDYAENILNSVDDPEFSNRDLIKISEDLSSELLELFLLQQIPDLNKIQAHYIFNKPQVKLVTIHDFDLNQLIKHMLSIVKLIEIANKKNRNAVKTLGYSNLKAIREKVYFNFTGNKYPYINIMDVFNLNDEDVKTIKSYGENHGKYIRVFQLKINSKYRKITTYSDNKYGLKLRKLHEKLLIGLNKIIAFSTISYGFKLESSIQKTINEHIKSKSFLKMDIKEFYGSIKYRNLYKIIKFSLDEDPVGRFDEFFISPNKSKYINWKPLINYNYSIGKSRVPLSSILKVMLVKYKVPFGFITSPKLSDIYMHYIDELMLSKNKDIIITRYADDLLVSSNQENFDFTIFRNTYIEYLTKLKLQLNNKKTINKYLKVNDSIKFLGLNIVNTGKVANEITIGRQYLLDTSKLFSLYLNKSPEFPLEKFLGRIAFIKYSSDKSYNKLLKIIKVKTGIDYDHQRFIRYISRAYLYNV